MYLKLEKKIFFIFSFKIFEWNIYYNGGKVKSINGFEEYLDNFRENVFILFRNFKVK